MQSWPLLSPLFLPVAESALLSEYISNNSNKEGKAVPTLPTFLSLSLWPNDIKMKFLFIDL